MALFIIQKDTSIDKATKLLCMVFQEPSNLYLLCTCTVGTFFLNPLRTTTNLRSMDKKISIIVKIGSFSHIILPIEKKMMKIHVFIRISTICKVE